MSGMNTVLAKPAISVMAVSAWTRRVSNQWLAVANAGSYSVADMVRPIAAQIRYSAGMLLTWVAYIFEVVALMIFAVT